MSKKASKSQASSGRAAFSGFQSAGFGTSPSSVLSFVQEPPNYASVDDSNIVLGLKSLAKRDGTTKLKALEDLQSIVRLRDSKIEDGFLEAWVRNAKLSTR